MGNHVVPTLLVVPVLGVLATACVEAGGPNPPPPPPPPSNALKLQPVVNGLSSPVYLTAPPGDSRLFVVERTVGRIRVVKNGQLLGAPFLNIGSKLTTGGEQGLLSVAFHPNYASNGFFYVNYTDNSGDTKVERYTVSAGNPDVADPNSAKLILMVNQPYDNHNGGLNLFGPDGKLYIGMGDGGSGGDPQNRAQNIDSLLGKLLRIDVDAGDPYGVPSDNPFVGRAGRDEIWALGLRNPWRFSFDRTANMLYIGDVGQGAWEEIDAVDYRTAGVNYGWRVTEGNACYNPSSNCIRTGITDPVLVYDHGSSGGCAVIGGYVYRGTAIPAIQGVYFYSDNCSGWLKSFTLNGTQAANQQTWNVGNIGSVLSFGEDDAREMYILSANGTVYQFVPGP